MSIFVLCSLAVYVGIGIVIMHLIVGYERIKIHLIKLIIREYIGLKSL